MPLKLKAASPMSKFSWLKTVINKYLSLFTSVEELRKTVKFPSQAEFFSQLKQETISNETYNDAKKLYETRLALPKSDPNKWYNMSDYLKYYNLLDVEPLKVAMKTCFENYMKYFHVDGLSRLSLPSIGFQSMYRLFDGRLPYVWTFNKTGDCIRRLFRNNVLGGLSTVFHR